MTNNNRRNTLKYLSVLTLLIVFSLPAFGQDSLTIVCKDRASNTWKPCGEVLNATQVPVTDALHRNETAKLTHPIGSIAFPVVPARSAQSNNGPGLMVAMGGTIGATSTGSPFTNAQTVAGGFVDGRASFKLFGATVTGRMLTGVENGVRFAPGSTDAVLNFAPSMYMELPLSENWGFLVGGVLDGQRVQGTTIMNPGMSFGLIRHTRDSVQTGTFTYLYDDVINNGVPAQFFRGYRGSFELQRWWGGVGFLAGVDGDRQAVPGLLTSGPQTQIKARFGIGFRPKPVN